MPSSRSRGSKRRGRKLRYGPKGGLYYMRNGRKVYVKSTPSRRRTKKRKSQRHGMRHIGAYPDLYSQRQLEFERGKDASEVGEDIACGWNYIASQGTKRMPVPTKKVPGKFTNGPASVTAIDNETYKVCYRGREYRWTPNALSWDITGPAAYLMLDKSPQDGPWLAAVPESGGPNWHVYHTSYGHAMLEVDVPERFAQEINPWRAPRHGDWMHDTDNVEELEHAAHACA
jgi:hypothetical protein